MAETREALLAWFALLGPNLYVRALAIVVAFFVLARIADVFIGRFVKGWVAKTRYKSDDELIAILHRPVFVSIVLIGLALAALVLKLPPAVSKATLAILQSIAVLMWALFAIRFIRLVLRALSASKERFELVQETTLPLFNNLALIVITVAAIYYMLLSWSVDVTAWVASAGIIGLALSFAAKDTLANLFAGVFILTDAPYKIGDFIVLDSTERGQVTHIGIRSTRLLTRDDVEITVPNAVMGNAKITNETGGPSSKYRIRVQVGVAYGSDIDQVREILVDIAAQQEDVCEDPEPRVRFRTFGASGLNFELLCWVAEPVLRGRVQDALNCEVYKRFMSEGIEIPYPKQDVYIKTMPQR